MSGPEADPRTLSAVMEDLDDALFKIEQASEIALEVAQSLHDNKATVHIIDRLSFCTRVIDDAVAAGRNLSDEARKLRREA